MEVVYAFRSQSLQVASRHNFLNHKVLKFNKKYEHHAKHINILTLIY